MPRRRLGDGWRHERWQLAPTRQRTQRSSHRLACTAQNVSRAASSRLRYLQARQRPCRLWCGL